VNIPPRILVIAGSDSSGGAGIQADIKTITMLGGYAMTAITCVTAQNTLGVTAVEALSPEMVGAQIDACLSDIGVDAVKIGMLGSPEIAAVVADRLEGLLVPIVFDPVMVATSGAVLANAATIAGFEPLMKLAIVTTPNLPELAALSGMDPTTNEFAQSEAAAQVMKTTGARAILAKGGHWPGGSIISHNSSGDLTQSVTDDLVFDSLYALSSEGHWSEWEFHHERIATPHTHGTGCTLSSAIATLLGQGQSLPDAVRTARDFVRAALLNAPGFGSGHGPMGHQAVRLP
jgi:hydroxymethylpyrimidine/phosphomethylpyrimidine kinase